MTDTAKSSNSRWSPSGWRARTKLAAGLLLVACLLGLIWLLAYHFPESLPSKIYKAQDPTGRFHAEEIARRRTAGLAILAGVLAAMSAIVAGLNHKIARDEHRLANRNHDLARRGQMTDRYGRAIEHLNNDNLGIRLGGIYALEGIAREEAQEHQAVYSVMAAFIRTHKGGERPSAFPDARHGTPETLIPLPDDVRTALAVILRRPEQKDPWQFGKSLFAAGWSAQFSLAKADLSAANLEDANLVGLRLAGANLSDANLSDANLSTADLEGALMMWTDLPGADLTGANLTDTRLSGADLTDAKLIDAKLINAVLDDADLIRTNLRGANLTGANLSGADLTGANLTGATLSDRNREIAKSAGAIGL